MGMIGRVVVSEGLEGKLGKDELDGLVASAYSELPHGILEPSEHTAMSLTDGRTVFSIHILNNPESGAHDFWVGKRSERCPYIDEEGYTQVHLDDGSDPQDSDEEDTASKLEDEEESQEDGIHEDEDEEGNESMESYMESRGIRLPSQSEIMEAMRKHHEGRQDEVLGVTPQGIELRLERVPPFRLRLFQGGKMTHELPLWSLGLVDVLKEMLDFTPFCFGTEGEGGVFNGSDERWVSWSVRKEPS